LALITHLFDEVPSLQVVMDDHNTATFRQERARWDTDRSMLAHLTTTVNLIHEGMDTTLDDLL
jgi:hypothetical protein